MDTPAPPAPIRLDATAADLHGEAARLRALGPVVRVELPDRVPAWAVTGYLELRELLADPRVSKDARHWRDLAEGAVPEGWPLIDFVANPGMNTSDGDDHRRLRALVTQAFTPRRIAAMRPEVEAVTAGLLDALAARASGPEGRVDLRQHFAYPLPMRVIGGLLGVPEERHAEFRALSQSLVDSGTTAEEGLSTRTRLLGLLTDLVRERRAHPGDDLASALVTAREDGDRLSEEELLGTLVELMVAGHGTTLNLITNAVRALLARPGQLAAAMSGALPWSAVIEETLRWDSPVAHFPLRYATEDIELGGVTIREGDAILASYAATGRDGGQFGPGAGEFDAARGPIRHLAFGHGAHYCIGAALARLEAEVALPALFARFPALTLGVPEERLVPLRSLVSNSVAELPVVLTGAQR
ncbi:cytochrome P450 [Streptomyces sp. ODS28]|uniref:cytochrome P450 family protein n=1 Tax=Streptomyces sp. ODS28 TaxID=3136688 RepID=UPI0031E808B4